MIAKWMVLLVLKVICKHIVLVKVYHKFAISFIDCILEMINIYY